MAAKGNANNGNTEYLWKDRKRNWLGLPWTFTKYALDSEKFHLDKGVFSTTSDEVRLYRIADVSLKRSFWQRIIGTGTIMVSSYDKSLQNFSILNIKEPERVRTLLSDTVEKQREEKRVYARENIGSGHEFGDDSYDNDFHN